MDAGAGLLRSRVLTSPTPALLPLVPAVHGAVACTHGCVMPHAAVMQSSARRTTTMAWATPLVVRTRLSSTRLISLAQTQGSPVRQSESKRRCARTCRRRRTCRLLDGAANEWNSRAVQYCIPVKRAVFPSSVAAAPDRTYARRANGAGVLVLPHQPRRPRQHALVPTRTAVRDAAATALEKSQGKRRRRRPMESFPHAFCVDVARPPSAVLVLTSPTCTRTARVPVFPTSADCLFS